MLDQSSTGARPANRLAVLGASGHTGRFVVAELLRRGLDPIAIGRDRPKLAALARGGGLETGLVDIDDADSLDDALRGAAAVINCAGPFLDTAEPVVSAALRARIPYLDITAEQASALATFERFDEPARAADVAVIPAMGFYGGLGDLLATATLADWSSADELSIAIALDSWRPTAGTRRTGERNRARRLRIADGRLQPLPDPAPTGVWRFPAPFGSQDVVELPFPETILVHRHLKVGQLRSYLNVAPLRDLRDSSTPPPEPTDDTGRSAQTFLIEAVARRGDQERRASVRGRDIYAVTAPLVVEAVQRLLGGAPAKGGVFAPGDRFDAAHFLRSLAPQHLIYEPACLERRLLA